jgi:hypothetical protein
MFSHALMRLMNATEVSSLEYQSEIWTKGRFGVAVLTTVVTKI